MSKYPRRRYTTLEFVLLGLVPYTRPNLLLAFKPNKFFDELERISGANRSSLYSTLSRARLKGYIADKNGTPALTSRGLERIKPYVAKKLRGQTAILVAFDIPEASAAKRRQFRTFLKTRGFKQAQKSVWLTNLDYRQDLKNEIETLGIDRFVNVYECFELRL